MDPIRGQLSAPPWCTSSTWQEANDALKCTIERHRDRLGRLHRLARRIGRCIEGLEELLEDLCRLACPSCTDSCCRRAWVWFDFKDLLVMHLAGGSMPPGQLRGMGTACCRYLTHAGCKLPRVQRPYICTWYLCAGLKQHLLQRPPSAMQHLTNSLTAIKSARMELEDQFVRIIAGRGSTDGFFL